MNAPYRSKKPCRALEYWLLPFNVQWLNTANNAKTFNLLLVFFCYKFNGSFKSINQSFDLWFNRQLATIACGVLRAWCVAGRGIEQVAVCLLARFGAVGAVAR